MNITYLIGNGFDRNLGLKTSYKEFYNYYKQQDSANEEIKKFKKKIDIDSERWSDLEIALGEETANYSKWEIFEDIYLDINFQLKKYLLQEESKLQITPQLQEKIIKDLIHPEVYLYEASNTSLRNYRSNWNNTKPWNVNIITFNYTNSIERLLDVDNIKDLMNNEYQNPIRLKNIFHIHGTLSEEILVGVNDASQIKNEAFRNNPDAMDMLVKPNTNKMFETLITDKCSNIINSSNLICLFGVSIGDTDKMWWKCIGARLFCGSDKIKMIIFHRGNEMPKFKLGQIKRKCQQYFLKQANQLKIDEQVINRNIFVAYNTNMFSKVYTENNIIE
mgnify:CR=1 FL=1